MANWCANRLGELLEFGYGDDGHYPQFAALHLDTGYLRIVYSENAGWGTSLSLLPCLWTRGKYFQGSRIQADWKIHDGNMIIEIRGSIAGLPINGSVTLRPPDAARMALEARVEMTAAGTVALDDRPGEAFKPALLSSMHLAGTDSWDTCAAVAGSDRAKIPATGWIFDRPVIRDRLALIGGTSVWKRNGPTVEVTLDREMAVTGWVSPDTNPNDDNVTFWAAMNEVLPSWSYKVIACAKTLG